MACDECGGTGRGPLPGMACRHCGGGSVGSRRGRVWVAVAVVVAFGCVVAAVSLTAGATEVPARTGGEPPVRTLPMLPTRNGPTGFPGPGGEESSPSAPPTSAAPTRTRTPTSPPPYEVWAGPGCAGGSYAETGRYEDGDEGWYTVATGGYRGGGCDGRFSSLPMSGSPTGDHDNAATWSWHVGPGYRTCALAVHIPRPPRPRDAAGDPSVYQVLANGTLYATFTLDQAAHPGTLVPAGTHVLRTPTFTVRLLDRGQDWGTAAREGAHHAAGQMRLTCVDAVQGS